jgi:hypothetical protein
MMEQLMNCHVYFSQRALLINFGTTGISLASFHFPNRRDLSLAGNLLHIYRSFCLFPPSLALI